MWRPLSFTPEQRCSPAHSDVPWQPLHIQQRARSQPVWASLWLAGMMARLGFLLIAVACVWSGFWPSSHVCVRLSVCVHNSESSTATYIAAKKKNRAATLPLCFLQGMKISIFSFHSDDSRTDPIPCWPPFISLLCKYTVLSFVKM